MRYERKEAQGGFLSPEHESRIRQFLQNRESIDFRQIEIVPTTKQHYITGVYALNIPSDEGTTGDWHSDVFWRPKYNSAVDKISLGGKADFDTNHIYGEFGVQEAREKVLDIGLYVPDHISEVYVANHTRATLDLAFSELNRYGRVQYAKGASADWLDTPEQKNTLLQQAEKLGKLFVGTQLEELSGWIDYERDLN